MNEWMVDPSLLPFSFFRSEDEREEEHESERDEEENEKMYKRLILSVW